MNTQIHTTNFDMTPAIEEYVSKKVSSLEKFLNTKNALLCEVELGKTTGRQKSGEIFRAEFHISEGGKQISYAVAEEIDLYSAIDVVRDETERIIVGKKTKRDTLFRRGASKVKSLLKRISN